ncbi:MAG: hypothetical protein VB118_04910 [Oscillospiraceae bacterium]|nr:hypothetical protein [Oscillospiraceae bacterium]
MQLAHRLKNSALSSCSCDAPDFLYFRFQSRSDEMYTLRTTIPH